MHRPRESRRNVLVRGRMRAGGPPMDVCIRNASSRGLFVLASAAPPRGTFVELVSGNQRIVGQVVWGKDRRFGVRTRDRVDVLELIGGSPAGAPARGVVARPAPPSRATRTETIRPRARAMEFAVVGLFAALLVAAVGAAAFEAMAGPFETISARLGRR